MGLFKKVKKAINRTVRKVENFAHRATGRPEIGEKEPTLPDAEVGTRAAAAKRLVNTQKQAGAGQISYNTMEEEQT